MRDDIASRILRDGWQPQWEFDVATTGFPRNPAVSGELPALSQSSEISRGKDEGVGEFPVESDDAEATAEEEVDISDL